MKIVIAQCRDRISPKCKVNFRRKVQRGRPQVNCDECKSYKIPAHKRPAKTHECNSDGWDCMVNNGKQEHNKVDIKTLTCPCGNSYNVNMAGRGRKATKCETCRDAGTVYRENEDGELETISAERLAEEQRKKAEADGRARADNLVNLMAPLLAKRHREVIVH